MEEFGEKMKTHVSKISSGLQAQYNPQGKQRVTMNYGGVKLKISKWAFHHGFS